MKKVLKVAGVILAALVVVGVGCATYLVSTSDTRMSAPATPFPQLTASTDPAVIERGRYVARTVGHCSQCHADYPRSETQKNTDDAPLSGGIPFIMGPMGGTYAANLTPDPDTGIGKRTDAELARTISTRVLADGRVSIFMRYSGANLSQDDIVAVVSYLRSLQPVKHEIPSGGLTTLGKLAFSMLEVNADTSPPPVHVERSAEASLERGRYLVEGAALCVACHTTYDPMTFAPVGPKAAGGSVEPSHGDDTDKEFVAPNLTADPKTGITGMLSEEQFLARIRAGRVHLSSIMPWENFSRMDDSDLRSIYRYLRTLPPVENDVGPTYRDAGWSKPAP